MATACLETIKSIGLGVRVRLTDRALEHHPDGELDLISHGSEHRYAVEITRSHLSYATASGVIERARSAKRSWLLFAPYVPPKVGEFLASHQVSYADTIGNCHLIVERGRLLAHVEGKKLDRVTRSGSGGRVQSYQLVFAILAQPELLKKPVREIAEATGIGKSAAADQLRRLERQGLIDRKRALLLRRSELRDRWLSAYADIVRPAWLIGRYRTRTTDPEQLEQEMESAWTDEIWALGGGAAAWRMTGFHRGIETVVHVRRLPADAIRGLKAIPDPQGHLTVLGTPGTIAYQGTERHLAHPLLVYTEMVSSSEPRLRESAAELEEHLPGGAS